MKLIYRGVRYDSTETPLPTVETGHTGRYRGLEVHFRHAESTPPQPVNDLTYRGVAYRTGAEAFAPSSVPASRPVTSPISQPLTAGSVMSTQSISARARVQMMSRHHQAAAREQLALDRAAAELGLGHLSSTFSRIQGKMQHDIAISCEPSSVAMS
jgi:hypothetical protein